MNVKRTQQGMTFWGMMVVVSVSMFFGLLALRLFPVYSDDFKISRALDSLTRGSEERRREDIVEQFRRQLEVNDVISISHKDLKLEPKGSGFFATLDYEVRVPIIHNVDAVVKFSHQRDLP